MFIIKEGTNGGQETPDDVRKSIIEWLEKDQKMILRTSEEEESFIKNKVQDEINTITKERARQIEVDVEQLTGIKPNGNEKYFDYLKRAFNDKIQSFETKIEELEKSGAGKGDNQKEIESFKTQIKDLEGKLQEKETGIEAIKTEYAEKERKSKVNQLIDSSIESMKGTFKKIDDTFLQKSIKQDKSDLLNSFDVRENEAGELIIYQKGSDLPERDKAGQPIKLSQKVNETFSAYIDTEKAKTGAGTGKPGAGVGSASGGNDSKSWKDFEVTAKTKVELHEQLRSAHKMDPISKDFNEAYEELGKDLPLR